MRVIAPAFINAALFAWSYQAPQGAAASKGLDGAAVATVLEDLVGYRGKDSPIDSVFSPKPLTLDPVPARYSVTSEEVLQRDKPESWQALSPAEISNLTEAASDLVGRTADTLDRFTAGSAHVPLYAGGDAEAVSSWRKRPIRAWLPGYSKDRRLALVRLSIPWSIHSCDATYVLIREGSVWNVRVRQSVCHP